MRAWVVAKRAGVESTLASIRAHIRTSLGAQEDSLVAFRPSRMDALQASWAELESSHPEAIPHGLGRFFQLCDGFTDNRYTHVYGAEVTMDQLRAGLAREPDRSGFMVATCGDGEGLDEKRISILRAELCTDRRARFLFHDYLLAVDLDHLRGMRERVDPALRESFDRRHPLLMSYGGAVETEGDAEFIHVGPADLDELLEYILSTAKQV